MNMQTCLQTLLGHVEQLINLGFNEHQLQAWIIQQLLHGEPIAASVGCGPLNRFFLRLVRFDNTYQLEVFA